MTCERCGKEISDSAAICPSCGTVVSSARASVPPPVTSYGQFPPGEHGNYNEYAPRQSFTAPPPIYTPAQQVPGPYNPYNPPPMYQPGQVNVNIVNNFASSPSKNSSALLVEIFLSLIGIYGVGWRMAGKKTVGTVLLIGSIVYWVLALKFIILTWGFGILCLCPVSFILIIVNAILLNNTLNRQATQFTTVQAQQMQRPSRQMRPQ
jgi:zinc-ribbon domain